MKNIMKKEIKFKRLYSNAQLPTYAHDGDIGMDVYAVSVEYDQVNDVYIYGTGLACETSGHMGVLGMMKSSVYKHGDAYLVNAVGLIDSDQFRGEIKYIYRNNLSIYARANIMALDEWSSKSIWYKLTHRFGTEYDKILKILRETALNFAPYQKGEAIGQLVPVTFDKMKIVEVNELSKTERGEGGFGSTDASKKKSPRKKIENTLKIN